MTVKIVQFKWAGKLGPFKIKNKCDECNLTTSILTGMINNEFAGKDITFETKPWLDNFFYCIFRFTWHPPIIMVDGKKFHQFSKKDPIFNREKFAEFVLNKLN